jgi:predicted kinase
MNDARVPCVAQMYGIAGAGRTTYALDLEREGHVRLSIDEEAWRRCGRYGIDCDPAQYASHGADANVTLRQRLVEPIGESSDVVVDFSFRRRERRDLYKRLIEQAGARSRLIYLKADPTLLRTRLNERNRRFDANAAFPITDTVLSAYLDAFEEPRGEGETVIEQQPERSD